MKNYNLRNFIDMLKSFAFAHVASALVWIFFFSSGESQYYDKGDLSTINAMLLVVGVVIFAVNAVGMLYAHFRNSEKKMNFLNATYSGDVKKNALETALKEGATAALSCLAFQLPMVIMFMIFGYRYSNATIFETLYVCDVATYILLGNSIVGAIVIAAAYFTVYFLGVMLVVCPMWNMARIRKEGAPVVPNAPEQDAYYRNVFENKYKIFYAIRKFGISFLISWAVIFFASPVIAAAAASSNNSLFVNVCYGIIYVIVFYCIHGYRRDSSYFPHEKKFSFVKETVAFCKSEMMNYMVIFAFLAVICEINLLIPGAKNLMTSLLLPLFPFYTAVGVPVVRSLICLAWAFAAVIFCAVMKSYSAHRKVSRASKYRR